MSHHEQIRPIGTVKNSIDRLLHPCQQRLARPHVARVEYTEVYLTEATRARVTAELMAPALAANPEFAERFLKEGKFTAKLQHPSVVQVYDFGVTAQGLFFYAMELLDGVTLTDLIARGPMPLARTVGIVRQIAEALREAHGKRIVHRDLAPSNLMLTVRGETYDVVKVLDFGLVKRIRTVAGDEPVSAAKIAQAPRLEITSPPGTR